MCDVKTQAGRGSIRRLAVEVDEALRDDEVYIKGRVANALERFNERKDDWSLAEEIAVEERAPAHSAGRGWVANIYKRIRTSHIRRGKEERTRSRRNEQKTSSAVREACAALAQNKKRLDKKKGGRVLGESLGEFRKKKKEALRKSE